MNAGNLAPTSKVAATGVAGAAVLVVQYVLELCGLDLPEDVALAAMALVMFLAGYVKTERQAGKHEAAE